MTITRYAGDRIVGLSTDTKPTNIIDGAVFFESDTKKIYLKISSSWEEVDYDNYTDAEAVSAIKADADWNATDWDTAYGWGDHSTEGYIKDATSDGKTYGRKDGAWAEITGSSSDFIEILSTAPSDPVEEDIGRVFIFTGTTTEDFIENHFYEAKSAGGVAGYLVSGAGTTASNGVYTPTGSNYNGQPIYTMVNGETTYYLYYQQNDDSIYYWVIDDTEPQDNYGSDYIGLYANDTLTGDWQYYGSFSDEDGEPPLPNVAEYVPYTWEEVQIDGASNLNIIDKTEDYTIQISDLGKVITMDATVSKTLTLPSVGSSDIGLYFTIVKKGSGDLVIQASDSDTILDSTAGGTLSNTVSTDVYSALTLVLISETEWIVKETTSGTWVTA